MSRQRRNTLHVNTPARKRASSDHFARRKQRVASVGCVDTLRTSVDLRATTNKTDDVLNTLRT